ncbi:MAG: nucleotidyltransferase [bacterium]|nr:MAG: nucleotidyltransferase [bacterium]
MNSKIDESFVKCKDTTPKNFTYLWIKKLILQAADDIKIVKVILFGSRARGDYNKYSDWDILVVVKDKKNIKEKQKLAKSIRTILARFLIDCDVIVKSEKELDYYKNFIGSITKEALKEGIKL